MDPRRPGHPLGPDRSGSWRDTSSAPGAAAEQSRSRLRLCSALGACTAGFVLLAVAVVTHLGATSLDVHVWRWLVEHRSDQTVGVFSAVSHIGDPLSLLLVAVAAGVWLARRRSIAAGFAPAAALAAASLTETVLKQVVGRSRPPVFARLLTETDPSFPSGHTTGTAAVAVTVALLAAPLASTRQRRFAAVLAAGLVAAAVGCARLVLGVHWLTDVAAGWLLGTGWAIGVTLLVPLAEQRLADRRPRAESARRLVRSAAARTSSADAA